VGHPAVFFITPGEGLNDVQVMVPEFKSNLLPSDLFPNHGNTLPLPGYLSWHNAALNLDITVEIWQGNQQLWSKKTPVVDSVLCDANLVPGSYLWRVITTDINGNTAATEATFTLP
jgi:hypothetical protein